MSEDEIKAEFAEYRRLLIGLGGGARNTLGTNTWVEPVIRDAAVFMCHGSDVVIADVRYPNEVDAIRELGGVLVGLVRPGAEPAAEYESVDLGADVRLFNDAGLEELRAVAADLPRLASEVLSEIVARGEDAGVVTSRASNWTRVVEAKPEKATLRTGRVASSSEIRAMLGMDGVTVEFQASPSDVWFPVTRSDPSRAAIGDGSTAHAVAWAVDQRRGWGGRYRVRFPDGSLLVLGDEFEMGSEGVAAVDVGSLPSV
jgi:hypothetical protein